MADAPVKMTVTVSFPVVIDTANYPGAGSIDEAIREERTLLSEKDEYLAEAIMYALEEYDSDDIEVHL